VLTAQMNEASYKTTHNANISDFIAVLSAGV